MCHHRRLIYSTCNHHIWLSLIAPCPLELSFETHQTTLGCGAMWSHAFNTVRVETMCPACLSRKSKLDTTVTRLRERLQSLNQDMARRTTPKKSRDSLESTSSGVLAGSDTSVSEGSEDTGKEGKDASDLSILSEPEGLETEDEVEAPVDVEFMPNEFYTGRTCLGSTTLKTADGVILY